MEKETKCKNTPRLRLVIMSDPPVHIVRQSKKLSRLGLSLASCQPPECICRAPVMRCKLRAIAFSFLLGIIQGVAIFAILMLAERI